MCGISGIDMRIEMKEKKKIVVVILLLIFAFAYAYVAKTTIIYDKSTEEYYALGVQERVEQSVVCQEKTWDGVDIKCQVIGESLDAEIKMTVVDTETGRVKAEVKKPISELKNGKFNRFLFSKIKDCKGKTYKIIFENIRGRDAQEEGVGFLTQADGTWIMKMITRKFDIETFVVLMVILAYIVIFFRVLYRLFSR